MLNEFGLNYYDNVTDPTYASSSYGGGSDNYMPAPAMTEGSNPQPTSIDASRNAMDVQLSKLSGMLKSLYQNGVPTSILDKLRSGFENELNKAYRNAAGRVEERIAGSGLRNSGVLTAVLSNLYGNKGMAQSQFESGLASQDLNARMNALRSLLGLGEYQAGLTEQRIGGDRNYGLSQSKLNFAKQQWQDQLDAYNEANAWYNTILPSLLGIGGKIGAAAINKWG